MICGPLGETSRNGSKSAVFGIQRQHTDPLTPIKDPHTFVVGCVSSQLFFSQLSEVT